MAPLLKISTKHKQQRLHSWAMVPSVSSYLPHVPLALHPCKTGTSDIKLVGRHRKEGGDDILGEGLVNLPGNFFYKGL